MTIPNRQLLVEALRAPTYVTVRRRLFRQLLESLVYEDAIRATTAEDGSSVVDGSDDQGRAVRYVFTARRRHGFDRVALGPEAVRRVAADGTSAEADSVTRFLGEARQVLTADPECLSRFCRELEATLVKDALAQHIRTRRGDVLAEHDYDTLEGTVTDGHRYHPTYKSRIGFDLDDHVAYGPEFRHPIRPLWIAAQRDISRVAISDALTEDDFLAAQLGHHTLKAFQLLIREVGRDPEDYAFLPVHPWQWREQIAPTWVDQLRRREIIPLGDDPHTFAAQQSIRTLSCRDAPERAYLKLALSIVNTSTSRVLAPYTVRNAPAVSDWLRDVVARDAFLRDECQVIVLGEVMGTAVDPAPAADLVRSDTYGTLACIWRESLHPFLRPGERAMPFTGLTARELDGTPAIAPWINALGVRGWLRHLVRASVVPLLHLLFRHGIACESHAQNMVLVHTDGVPQRVALRDFHDGVRFSRAHLAEPDACPTLVDPPSHHVNANSFLETDDLDQVADFLLDAFFFINFGELALFLDDAYQLDERDFWSTVRDEIRAYQKRFPELGDRFELFDVFKPTIEVEKLTTRRLLPDTELRVHTVPNPLAEPATRCRPHIAGGH
ncbi:siderophore biosynthesis protein [Streptomyces piniterrae]|uniref:Siderophore biosynthesis protein n=1 Tax=Streptomyces piniterrae TaxID=2571125 RepID=A0A4U0NIT0_9ACTN|nr:IucA/IucC family protein [Streptomyces piniterrae]TJZ54176.1 siderophore biosynthesis protein [Streptomyces piniterrae]